jgi:hypothetical protein
MAKRIKLFLHNPSEVLLTNIEQRDGHMQSLDQDKFFFKSIVCWYCEMICLYVQSYAKNIHGMTLTCYS